MAGSLWDDMYNFRNSPSQFNATVNFYLQGLEIAEKMRPLAKFGYWGLPKQGMTPDAAGTYKYGRAYHLIARLLNRSAAIFPDTYEGTYSQDVDPKKRGGQCHTTYASFSPHR